MEENQKFNEATKAVLILEYEQTCEDWRNRDSMLWQALALLVAISGAAFSFSFSSNLEFFPKLIALMFTLILCFLAMVKIVKDHYYQNGSRKYLSKLSEALCDMNHKELLDIVYLESCNTCDSSDDCKANNPRHHNCEFDSHDLELFKIKLTSLIYKKITGVSAFKVFYCCNLLIIIQTLIIIFWLSV